MNNVILIIIFPSKVFLHLTIYYVHFISPFFILFLRYFRSHFGRQDYSTMSVIGFFQEFKYLQLMKLRACLFKNRWSRHNQHWIPLQGLYQEKNFL